ARSRRARSNPLRPAVRVLRLTALDGHEPLAELARVGADFAVTDPVLLAVMDEGADARQHGGGAGEHGLANTRPLQHLGNVEDPLLDPVTLLAREGKHRVEGHAVEES